MSFAKIVDEFDGINELVNEVTWVKIESKSRMIADGFQGPLGRSRGHKQFQSGELPKQT